ncbi:MAG: insulinase family protein [Ignavibacteriaceae bacterium]|nr:insulinase family protein [Ignavibacteriaceae bacterium]
MTEIKFTTLPSGVRVVTETIPYLQSFSLGLWFDIGTRDEKKDELGIAHFAEHMLFKGTKKRNARKISEAIESRGGYLNAFTSKEHTCYYARGLTHNLATTFDVMMDMVQNPLFRESEVRKEKGVIIDEILDLEDNPEELIFDKFEEIIFKGSPLALPILGTEKTVGGFSSEKLHKFHRQSYCANNFLVAVSGNIKHEQVLELVEKNLNKSLQKIRRKRKVFTGSGFEEEILLKNVTQVHCITGCPSYGYESERRWVLNTLSAILGDGSASRLYQSVREKLGITYQINSFINLFNETSAFGIYFSTSEKNLNRVLDTLRKEFENLIRNPVSVKELNRVKEYLKGNMILSLENNSGRMIRLANSVLYYNKVVTLQDTISAIDRITVEDVHGLAADILDENKLTRLVIKNSENNKNKAA